MQQQIQQRIDTLKAEGFKIESGLVNGQKKLIHIQGQIDALTAVLAGELAPGAPASEEVAS